MRIHLFLQEVNVTGKVEHFITTPRVVEQVMALNLIYITPMHSSLDAAICRRGVRGRVEGQRRVRALGSGLDG
jgi:hypothetical protein